MFNAHRRQIIDMIGAQRKPAIYSSIAWAREGGLISYSDDSIELWRGAARYIARVIRGAKPSELPVQEPTRFKLALNRKTAFDLGVVIQKQFLLQVDEIIH